MKDVRMQILEILNANAKINNATIAAMLGIDENQVAEQVKNLEAEGIIIGYSAVINPEKLHDDSVSALIEVKVSPQRDLGFDAIAEQIYSYEEVKSCYLMSGTYDLMVIVEGKNIKEVSRFVAERLSILDNVLSCSTHFILKRYKDNGRIFVNKESDRRLVVSP